MFRYGPRTRRDRALWTLAIPFMVVAEEVAFRGAATATFWYMFGNPWIAAAMSAFGFALGHAVQGWKSSVMVFVVALLLQGLVVATDALLYAVVVHAAYDLVAGG